MRYVNLGTTGVQVSELCLGTMTFGLDWIDIYLAHRFDLRVPVGESLHAFDILVQPGKVRYIGVLNPAAWR